MTARDRDRVRRSSGHRGERVGERPVGTGTGLGAGDEFAFGRGAQVDRADRSIGPLDERGEDAFDPLGEPIGLVFGHHRGVVLDLHGQLVVEVGDERHRVVRRVGAGEAVGISAPADRRVRPRQWWGSSRPRPWCRRDPGHRRAGPARPAPVAGRRAGRSDCPAGRPSRPRSMSVVPTTSAPEWC